MEYLFKKIQEKLTNSDAVALFNAKGLTPIKYFDLFKGQFQSPELFDVLPLPAVLFQWNLNLEDGTAFIGLHFGYESIRDTSQLSASQDNALKFFEYINTIHELVNELESENTNKLKGVGFEPIDLASVGIAHLLNYKCDYTQYFSLISPNYIIFTEPDTTQSIAQIHKIKPTIRVYPNPVRDCVNFDLNDIQDYLDNDVLIYDVSGREVKRCVINNSELKIKVGDLPNGIYFVQVGSDVAKFVKN